MHVADIYSPFDSRKEYWNQRYKEKEFIYGEDPNVFFAEQIRKLNPGKIILPCAGEGRNAVFAALLGWEVQAFDISCSGKMKSLELATKKDAQFEYSLANAGEVEFDLASVDVVALIFAHFSPELRSIIHQKAISWLKPGGKIIIEAFESGQINRQSGGPKDPALLYTTEILLSDFAGLQTELIEATAVELNEGTSHRGLANVVRYVGTKLS